jgi:hypothetical protein
MVTMTPGTLVRRLLPAELRTGAPLLEHEQHGFTKPSARLDPNDVVEYRGRLSKSSMSGEDTSADTFRRHALLGVQHVEKRDGLRVLGSRWVARGSSRA